MAKKDYENMTETLIMPLIEANHMELVDVEWVREGLCLLSESLY